jgi:hypothetical protein
METRLPVQLTRHAGAPAALLVLALTLAAPASAAPRIGVAAGPALLIPGGEAGGQLRVQLLTGGARRLHLGLEGGLLLQPNRAVAERCVDPTCSRLEVSERATDTLWHLGFALRSEGAEGLRPFFGMQLGYASGVRYGGERTLPAAHGASLSLGGGVRPWALSSTARLGLEAGAQGVIVVGEDVAGVGLLGSLALVLDFN